MKTIPFGKPIIGDEEKRAVCEVLDTGLLVHGPKIEEFEAAFAEFTGAPHAVGVSSCTAGLHLTYFALGIGEGDEVIVPAMTHVATAHAVALVGAKPVFVDAESETGNLNIDLIEAAVTERTKAISIVHFLGMPVDMERVCKLAEKHGLHVVEDCALAVGSRLDGVHAGLFGLVGCFSFYPVKHLTTVEGGMVITADSDLAAKLINVRAFGVDRHHGVRKVPGMYDVNALGFNYRMSEIHAVLGTEQMKRLPGFLQQRDKNFAALMSGLAGIDGIELLQSSRDRFQSSYYCLSLILDAPLAERRPDVMDALKSRGVGTSIYYPQPVPRMRYYREKYGYVEGSFPGAERISDRSVALPVGPHLNEEDMAYIADSVKRTLKEVRA